MKVLFVTRTMFPEVHGGGDVSAFEIARAVAKTDGAQAVVCCLSEKISTPIVEVLDGVKVYRFPWKKLKWFPRLSNLEYCYWQLWKNARNVQKKEHPDLVHLLNFSSVFPLAFGFRNVPKVATCNGPFFCLFDGAHGEKPCCKCSWSTIFNESWSRWGVKSVLFLPYILFDSWLLRRALLSCKKLFLVSEAMAHMLSINSIPVKKLVVVHNPVSVPKRGSVRVDADTIVYAGRLSKDKGIQFVIRALPLLPDVKFIIAGKGRFEGELRELVNDLNLNHRVEFLGFMDSKKLRSVVARAGVNVLLGTVYEALPRSELEASALGVPSVVSSAGGCGEAVGDGGIVLRSLDEESVARAIHTVLKNRKKYSKQARMHVVK